MNHAFGIPAIALGVAASVSLLSLGAAQADTSGPVAPAAAAPSAEPAPTPRDSGSVSTPTPMPPERPAATASRHYARHTAWRNEHRYYRSDNPLGEFAYGVAGGAADLGSMAAYPFYCFPNYGACHVRLPYRP